MSVRPKLGLKSSPVVVARAREMRHALTPTEAGLWCAIRGKQLGVVFRKQVPMGRYIADFVAKEARLVVEVDGGYHARRVAADARRDRAFARWGFRVLRLNAELVQACIAAEVERVRSALRE